MFVKICGITSEEDALLAVAMDADAVGFTFAPSERQISPTLARDIARRLPPEILTVGVFRDEAPERVVEIVNIAGLRAAQLHGHESVDATRYVNQRVSMVIKALPAESSDVMKIDEFGTDAVLIDAPIPGRGELFDWSLTDRIPAGHKLILAGGLTPGNVADAVDRVRPWGVDVASGVEVDGGRPGRKDPRKVRAFVANARAAAPAEWVPDRDAPYDWNEDA